MDQIEARAGFFCFVRLEMADQMPAERKIRGLVHLGQRFLDAVLAEIDLPGRRCFAYGFRWKCFGDGDESDGCRIAARTLRCARNASADVCEP